MKLKGLWGFLSLILVVGFAFGNCPEADSLNHYVIRKEDKQAIRIYYRLLENYNPGLPTLLVINGGPGGDHNIIGYFKKYAKFANVLSFDHRGVGCTSFLGPLSSGYFKQTYSMEKAAKDIDAVRKDLLGENGKWFVFGVSYGTMLGQQYLTDFPNSIHSIILDSAFHDGAYALPIVREQYVKLFLESDPETAEMYRKVAALYPGLINNLYLRIFGFTYGYQGRKQAIPKYLKMILTAKKEEAEKFLSPLIFPFVGMSREILCEEIWDYAPQSLVFSSLVSDCANFTLFRKSMDFTESLKKVKVPVMIWGGAFDPVTPIQAMREMHRLIPDSFLFENPHCGHFVGNEKPDCALELIQSWLKLESKTKWEAIAKSDLCQSPPDLRQDSKALSWPEIVGVENAIF